MTLPAIGAVSAALGSLGSYAPTALTTPTAPTDGAPVAGGTSAGFAEMLEKGINAVSSAQNKADTLAVQAATGDLTDIHDYTIAAAQAELVTQLATTIRTKGVDAFNQIMGMQA